MRPGALKRPSPRGRITRRSDMALAAALLALCSCAAFTHGATLSQYQGQMLPATGTGPGAKRLRMEADFDSTISVAIAARGTPDYVHVLDGNNVEIFYIASDTVLRFNRRFTSDSTATVLNRIPDASASQFTAEDRQRLAQARQADTRPPTQAIAGVSMENSPDHHAPPKYRDGYADPRPAPAEHGTLATSASASTTSAPFGLRWDENERLLKASGVIAGEGSPTFDGAAHQWRAKLPKSFDDVDVAFVVLNNAGELVQIKVAGRRLRMTRMGRQ